MEKIKKTKDTTNTHGGSTRETPSPAALITYMGNKRNGSL